MAILLPQSLEYQGYSCVPPCLAYDCLLCVGTLGKVQSWWTSDLNPATLYTKAQVTGRLSQPSPSCARAVQEPSPSSSERKTSETWAKIVSTATCSCGSVPPTSAHRRRRQGSSSGPVWVTQEKHLKRMLVTEFVYLGCLGLCIKLKKWQ